MKAADLMTTNVIAVEASQSIQEVASTLSANRISAVPVVSEAGEVVGIISEGDLMRRAETGTERHRSWWLDLLAGPATAQDYVKERARRVADVMTRQVITVSPDTSLRDIVDLMEENGIKRVPVVDNAKLVGIVSRANLIGALASIKDDLSGPPEGDEAIRAEILRRVQAEPWKPILLNVDVRGGTVELWGLVDKASQKQALLVAVETTPGVRGVNDNIILRSSLRIAD